MSERDQIPKSDGSTEDKSSAAAAAAAGHLKPSESGSLKSELSGEETENCVAECAVCLQSCVHPVRLPCSHVFCYLCVKGVAFQSKRCAMCRQEIPADFLLNPQLLDRAQLERESALDGGAGWFYEGRNGE